MGIQQSGEDLWSVVKVNSRKQRDVYKRQGIGQRWGHSSRLKLFTFCVLFYDALIA
jgi:hypothetical protein